MPEETFLVINDGDTVVEVTEAQFTAHYKPAGFRRVKPGQPIPPQAGEIPSVADPDAPKPVPLASAPSKALLRRARRATEETDPEAARAVLAGERDGGSDGAR